MENLNRGIVMKVNRHRAIVLTPDGQFLKHSFQGDPPEIGMEVVLEKQNNWDFRFVVALAALFALVIIPFFALQPLFNPAVFAYITVDINPSIELAVDKNDLVLSATPLNIEGQELLTQISLKNTPLAQALEIITEAAIQGNYIAFDRENTVFISYSKVESSKNTYKIQNNEILLEDQTRRIQLEEKIQEVVSRNQQEASVEFVHVSYTIRDKAQEIGLSTGKLAIVLEAKDLGLSIDLDSIRDKGIIPAIKEAGGNPGQLIKDLHKSSTDKYIAQEQDIIETENIKDRLPEGDKIAPSALTAEEINKINEIKEELRDQLPKNIEKETYQDLLDRYKDRSIQRILDKFKKGEPKLSAEVDAPNQDPEGTQVDENEIVIEEEEKDQENLAEEVENKEEENEEEDAEEVVIEDESETSYDNL